ncbi:MAG TPA: hypothetical protein VER03_20725 [Bryobacteraceae bacterium]|nr:hypothetical protein [Bryobacteraceae bacterium]
MGCRPTSNESLQALRDLYHRAVDHGDECLSLLLAGVELYIRAGREFELLEIMRSRAEDMRDAVENTPSADDLRRLYERD